MKKIILATVGSLTLLAAPAQAQDVGSILRSVLGGGLGSTLVGMMGGGADAAGGMDIGSVISSVAVGGVGGGILMAIIGMLKSKLAK